MFIDPSNFPAEFSFCGYSFTAAIEACKLLKGRTECEGLFHPVNLHAISAITLSLTACEGFINEMGHQCSYYRAVKGGEEEHLFGKLWVLAEECKASITRKFDIASECFRGGRWDYGKKVFGNFGLLIKIRNELVHTRTLRVEVVDGSIDAESVEKALEQKRLLTEGSNGWPEDWRVRALNRECATWALNTASDVVSEVLDAAPNLRCVGFIEEEYRKAFAVPSELGSS